MKVEYHFNSFDEKKMIAAISNLLLYYNDVSVNIRQKMEMLQKETRLRDKLVQYLRQGTGNMSLTVDSIFQGIENAVAMGDVFTFEVDGQKIYNILQNKKTLDITFNMNDYYFLTESAITRFFPTRHLPFGKKYDGLEGERLKWVEWIDNNFKHDRRIMNPDFTRKVIE